MSKRIAYTKPSITELEVSYAIDAAKNGWGEKCYEYINKFEEKFKTFTGVKYAIATSSCTGAMHMGLAALGIGPGDEVILADTNWIASAAPITYLGATPVFVDVLPSTWCIDPDATEKAITPKTKAIIAVHIYGNLCNMDKLVALGEKYGLPIIEDAAEAIGSYWHGRHAGSIAKFGVFSFHGTKTLTTGEGGMFISSDFELFDRVRTLSNHGRTKDQKKQFWADLIGFKYKMSNIEAAIGYGQIERIDQLIADKRRVFAYYKDCLQHLPLRMNVEPAGTKNGFWMPTIVVDASVPFDREKLLCDFSADDIDGRVFFWPLSMLPMFNSKPENKVSYSLYGRAVNLPSYYGLSEDEMDRVVTHVKRNLQSNYI